MVIAFLHTNVCEDNKVALKSVFVGRALTALFITRENTRLLTIQTA